MDRYRITGRGRPIGSDPSTPPENFSRIVSAERHGDAVMKAYETHTQISSGVSAELVYGPEQREAEQAMLFLDTWGSTSFPPTEWHGFRWSEDGAPDWLAGELSDCDPDQCVTVLSCNVGDGPVAPRGYRIAHRSQCGERDCPGCEATGYLPDCDGNTVRREQFALSEAERQYRMAYQADLEKHIAASRAVDLAQAALERAIVGKEVCPLCEGDRFVYWGEEWSLVVFAPAYTYGAGQSGYMYDYGPHSATSLREAWTDIRESLESVGLSRRSLARVLRDLRTNGIHYFDRRLRPFVGWDYVDCSEST